MDTIFKGLERAYGRMQIKQGEDGKKVAGKCVTIHEPLTPELWEKHLSGRQGLGVVPIMDDGNCWWGCIDIDDYSLDHKALIDKIEHLELPLVTCRSKSGGAHCFLFVTSPAPARRMRKVLSAWAAWLGQSGREIFPKQVRLASNQDAGNWLNMPYFNAEETDRYALNPRSGAPLSLDRFKELVASRKQDPEKIEDIVAPQVEELEGAPPCIATILMQGVGEGQRNTAAFNLAIYCRKRWPDAWEGKLDHLNMKVMDPPLGSKEVQQIVKSAGGKSYEYQCSEPLLAAVCDKRLCSTCKYGVGGAGYEPEITGLVKIDSDPPQWIIEVDNARMMIDTMTLTSQQKFRVRCLEIINRLPRAYKPKEWEAIINRLTDPENLQIIEAPRDAGPVGQLLEHLHEYVGQPSRIGKTRDDLLRHKVWDDGEYTYFRGPAFLKYLSRNHFRALKEHEIHSILKGSVGAKHGTFNIKGNCVAYWAIPTPQKQLEGFDQPEDEEGVPF